MKQNQKEEAQETGKKQVKIPRFPKFYVLCDRVYYGLEPDDEDPRSSRSEVFFEDNVTYVFENEDEYVDYIKTQIVTDYASLPMKNLCCKHFIGLDTTAISNICKAYYPHTEMIEWQCKETKKKYKAENFKNYVDDLDVKWRDRLFNVVKYVNLFDETSNNVIGRFILNHMTNKFYDLELEWNRRLQIFEISNYGEIVKDRTVPKKKDEAQAAENQENTKINDDEYDTDE